MPKRNLIWIGLILAVASLVAWVSRRPADTPATPEAGPLQPLQRLHDLTEREYYREVGPEVVDGALRGYLGELDPHCTFIPAARTEFVDHLIGGRSDDLGLRYEIVEGQVRVIGSVPESPALEAGVLPADTILAIDAHALAATDRSTVAGLIAGAEGETVALLVARDGEAIELELTRRAYPIETVTGLCRRRDGRWHHLIDPDAGIAYVRIGEFANGTGEALDEVMRPLLGDDVRAVVLDLRDNPGGPLREAVEVADRFIGEGLIVLTRDRGGVAERYPAHEARTYPRLHVAVLINERSASAPEVVAGAIRHHGRGVLVGAATFGKTLIQRPFSLGDDMGTVLLTTAQYDFAEPAEPTTRPTTAPPARAGVQPHVRVLVSDLAARQVHVHRYRAAAMPGPQATTQPTTAPVEANELRRQVEQIVGIDPALAEALVVLRGMATELPAAEPADGSGDRR